MNVINILKYKSQMNESLEVEDRERGRQSPRPIRIASHEADPARPSSSGGGLVGALEERDLLRELQGCLNETKISACGFFKEMVSLRKI
jgi:hypothetical protein